MSFQVKIAQSLKAVPAAAWDACALRAATAGDEDPHNPFVSYAFLSTLEDSGCVGGRTGWTPLHLVVEDESETLLGAVPCYLKSHSMGEYVFDHSCADAYTRAGGHYYPKLQVSVPFTPATGPRNGMFDTANAAEAAVMPITSDDPVLSADRTDAITWVSK